MRVASLLWGALVNDGARPRELELDRQRVQRTHDHLESHVRQASARKRHAPVAYTVIHWE